MADVPENLTQDFITQIWRNYYKDPNLTTTEFKIGLVGAKGDNYSSIMTRAECKIHTNNQTIAKSMVIKTLPTGAGVLKFVKESCSFEKETIMLSKVSPALEKILASAGIGTKLAAAVYYHAESEILAMEDLATTGYAVGNRHQGLALDKCLSVAKTLAEFHAASMVYMKNENLSDVFNQGIIRLDSREQFGVGFMDGLATIIDQIDNWSSEKWSHKLANLQKKLPDALFDTVASMNPNRPIVLNHGDLWLNNIMFNSTSELRFVDLQLSWMQSPVFDVQYFLFTSCSPDVRITHMEDILKAYHQRFTEVADLLKFPLDYSYQDFLADFQEHLVFAFSIFTFMFPIMAAKKEDAVDTSSEDPSGLMINNPIFSNQFFKTCYLAALPFFEQRGMFQ